MQKNTLCILQNVLIALPNLQYCKSDAIVYNFKSHKRFLLEIKTNSTEKKNRMNIKLQKERTDSDSSGEGQKHVNELKISKPLRRECKNKSVSFFLDSEIVF